MKLENILLHINSGSCVSYLLSCLKPSSEQTDISFQTTNDIRHLKVCINTQTDCTMTSTDQETPVQRTMTTFMSVENLIALELNAVLALIYSLFTKETLRIDVTPPCLNVCNPTLAPNSNHKNSLSSTLQKERDDRSQLIFGGYVQMSLYNLPSVRLHSTIGFTVSS